MCKESNRKCRSCRNCPLRREHGIVGDTTGLGMPRLEVQPERRIESGDIDVADPAVLQNLRQLGAV